MEEEVRREGGGGDNGGEEWKAGRKDNQEGMKRKGTKRKEDQEPVHRQTV
jgi:hypothetical protein